MKRVHLVLTLVVAVALLGVAGKGMAQPNPQRVVFSLDDNPVNPIMWPPYMPIVLPVGTGAEDPFGFFGVNLAPSPSIPAILPMWGPTWDSTILQAGTVVPVPDQHLVPTLAPDLIPLAYINAISADMDALQVMAIPVDFSVDRLSMGAAGTAVAGQAGLNQQPGDLFRAVGQFANPAQFVGTLPINSGYVGPLPTVGTGVGNNILMVDESQLTLTPGGPPGNLIASNLLAPPIQPGTHDNLDAAEGIPFDLNGDGLADVPWVFCINPDEATELNARLGPVFWPTGFSAADLYVGMAGMMGPATPATTFGLELIGPANSDDVDAIYARWSPGGVPFALFSLGPGSTSLAAGGPAPLSPADIFFTDFNGSFAMYLSAGDLGLTVTDNVDAIMPEPATLALMLLGLAGLLARRRRK